MVNQRLADNGLLSKRNIEALKAQGYHYIIGARLKTESTKVKQQILAKAWEDEVARSFVKGDDKRLVVHYSSKYRTSTTLSGLASINLAGFYCPLSWVFSASFLR
ncbi:hypothetical protein RP300_01227 [Oligella urethralis]|uniref:hypothetical protein n=1 Tax=Oligella urethralis TaxID=90245 RepID=UPI0029587838|nr:hypothetical protein [Oligella urethralis]WOS37674.1 hypothetical protein RP300_01227 [Oligella urethralis]